MTSSSCTSDVIVEPQDYPETTVPDIQESLLYTALDMAVLRHMQYGQMRQRPNKESDWSGLVDTVFDQYTHDDDVFGLGAQQRQSLSSDNSANLFDFSTSSGQSVHTTGTSPDPAWAEQVAMTAAAVESMPHVPYTEQPQPKESNTFWQKTLKALERNAVETDASKLHVLRTSKSHPDFLSLGGHPSPACVPCPVPDSSFSVPRSRPRESANGHAKAKSTSQLRSVSRGRPQGVAKNNTINNASTATMRKRSVSPTKMMTPSRYRAGYQEVWTNRKQAGSPTKYALRMPAHALPDSPPSSAHLAQQDFAAFSSPTRDPSSALIAAYDSELSPLTTTFQQQARIHTPDASPFFQPVSQGAYFDHNVTTYAAQPTLYNTTTQNVLPNSRIASFDFGFTAPTTQEPWAATYDHSAMPSYHAVPPQDVFGGVEQALDQTVFPAGLGINCDAVYYPSVSANEYAVPATVYQQMQPMQATHRACYAPMPDPMPLTPHKQRLPSRSPSPPMTEPRSRRASGAAGQRRGLKHRRAKSTTAIPRSSDKGGFVNFTPDDSGKILSGVAPSGSSKTKARREKEAADRRRRLSMAAVKAVVDAGGNLDSLAQAGLL